MNTANGGANGHHNLNMNAAINHNQFNKSLDDWLNSNCNNNMNSNHNGLAGGMMTIGGPAAAAAAAASVTNNSSSNNNSHLDDWLNATMKDSPKTFSVSSTEFLDGPSRNVINSNGLNTTSIVIPPINLLRMMPEYQVNTTQTNSEKKHNKQALIICSLIWC